MTNPQAMLEALRPLPLVAILRGLPPGDAEAVAGALVETGLRAIEVPLNRPGALEAIGRIAARVPAGVLVGGGTVLAAAEVDAVHAAGGRLVVAPNFDAAVVARAVQRGMLCAPGVLTPTEAFAALRAGAQVLKLFPCDVAGTDGLRALRSVLPDNTPVWPVGGIAPENIAAWRAAGADGFGIGSRLYQPGRTIVELARVAREFVRAWA